jgi:hypothetical protein
MFSNSSQDLGRGRFVVVGLGMNLALAARAFQLSGTDESWMTSSKDNRDGTSKPLLANSVRRRQNRLLPLNRHTLNVAEDSQKRDILAGVAMSHDIPESTVPSRHCGKLVAILLARKDHFDKGTFSSAPGTARFFVAFAMGKSRRSAVPDCFSMAPAGHKRCENLIIY